MLDSLKHKFEIYGNRTAIISNAVYYTYNQLLKGIFTNYQSLKSDIPEGSITILKGGFDFDSICTLFALALNKNIIVPVTETSVAEVNQRIAVSGADFEIDVSGNGMTIRKTDLSVPSNQLIDSLKDNKHSGIILFSSGITGEPKAMVHNFDHFIESYLERKVKNLNFMALLLFDHIGGLNTLMTSIFSGAVITIPSSKEPETICAESEKYKVNILPASPTMLNLILISGAHLRYDLSSIKIITYGTEPMPEGLLLKLNSAFPRTRFMQTYGTSETGISKMSSKSSSSLKVKFDDPDTEYKIVDNELWIKSKTTIIGYLNSSMDRFTEDGWFKTGDLVEIDNEGYINITGRNNEVINVGGLKVLPQEVESVLMSIPEIDNCIVYGEENAITGNIVVADIQLKKSVETSQSLIDEREARLLIKNYCREKLERYKIPVKLKFVEVIEYNERYKKIRK